ncbi:MAG: fructose-bisphosphatase class II family protein [Thermoleophilia bacterium]|nr:fructose-bisphosphatase class II family protein [Thermoleophilia bacterium]
MPTKRTWCICSRFASVTESAAIAAAEWLGRGDALAASLAARQAMAVDLGEMPIRARVVAGRGGDPSVETLSVGSEVGREIGPWAAAGTAGEPWSDGSELWALAVDPLQAPNSLARGADGALAMVAAGPVGSLMPVPEMYMQKLIVPPEAADAIDLDALVGDNIKGVAAALGRRPQDLSVVVLDRPRHEDLIAQIRATGASVRLVSDGDVSAGIAVASRDVGVDMCIGIGGSTEGILTAAALRCLGGEMQARFWPVSRHQVELVRAAGIEDIEARLSTRDMAGDGVLFVATAVTGGRFLKPVAHRADGIHTETLVLCSRCHSVRKIHTIRRPENGGPQVSLGAR